jgi:hypothetical protein
MMPGPGARTSLLVYSGRQGDPARRLRGSGRPLNGTILNLSHTGWNESAVPTLWSKVYEWRTTVQILSDLVEMARTCAGQARLTTSQEVAAALWKLASEYHERAQQRAADLRAGNVPGIGDPPTLLK